MCICCRKIISSSIIPRDQLLELLSYPVFDLSTGYRQIKSEPMMFVMLSYSWLFPRAYTIISFGSDQYYHIVHIMVELQWYGNSDELLLSHQQHLVSSMIHVEHQASVGNFCTHYLHVPCLKHMFGWKKWPPLIHVHLMQVAVVNSRKSMLPPLEPSQVSHACAKYAMVW